MIHVSKPIHIGQSIRNHWVTPLCLKAKGTVPGFQSVVQVLCSGLDQEQQAPGGLESNGGSIVSLMVTSMVI